MSKPGKFIIKNFKDREIDIFTSNENEYVHYSDTDVFSWTIVKGLVLDYDEDSGILTMETLETHKRFYLNDFKIELFWEPSTDYVDFIRSTINGQKGPKKKNRDIM